MASIDRYKKICEEFRQRWNECTSLEEMDKLREEFFSLPLDEERLEMGWDSITFKWWQIYYRRRNPRNSHEETN